MASVSSSTKFFQNGNAAQFDYVLSLYPSVLKLKAENRGAGKKPEKLIRLDDWYQNTLPKLIAKRGKEAHLLHEELCQTMEWKQTRGKHYPQLTHLIKINTPRAVMMETKKAFRKLPNLEQALNALSNLKGVGITMASALLAAASPENAPFMADECLMAIPEFESIDYTAKEYLKFVTHIQQTMDRLNKEVDSAASSLPAAAEAQTQEENPEEGGGADDENGSSSTNESAGSSGEKPAADKPEAKKWTAHAVELALWTHYIASDLRPELLKDMPEGGNGVMAPPTGEANGGGATDRRSSVNNDESNGAGGLEDDENSQNGGVEPSDESNPEPASMIPTAINGNSINSMDSIEDNSSVSGSGGGVGLKDQDQPKLAAPIPPPADSMDDCAKTGLDEETPAVATSGPAVPTPAADSDSQSSQSNSNSGTQKRSLDAADQQQELSAPKLIKL